MVDKRSKAQMQTDPLLWQQMRNANAEGRLPDPAPSGLQRVGNFFSDMTKPSPINETVVPKSSMTQGGTVVQGPPNQTPGTLEERRRVFGETGGMFETQEQAQNDQIMNSDPMSYDERRSQGRSGIIWNMLDDYLVEESAKYQLDEGEIDTALHDFSDTSTGRELSDRIANGRTDNNMRDMVREMYSEYLAKTYGPGKSKTVQIDPPLPVRAPDIDNEEKAVRVVNAAAVRPIVVTDADTMGFSSEKVMIVRGKEPVQDPESVLASPRPPVVTQRGFIDIMKYLTRN